jgi:predicted PurR-regulated permease PerM
MKPPVETAAAPAEKGDEARAPEATVATVPGPTDIRSVTLTVIAVIAIILVLQYAQAVVIPIVLGVLISYALEPGVKALERLRVPRAIGAAVMVAALTIGGAALLYGLRGQAATIVEQLPQAARRLRQRVESSGPRSATAIEQVQQAANELQKAATTPAPAAPGVQRVVVEPSPFDIGSAVMWGSLGLVAAAGQVVLILLLAFFMLMTGDLYRRKLVKIAGPSLTEKKITVQILSEIDRQIERFLMVQVFTSAVVAIATWLTFRSVGLQQAAVWGIVAGVFNSIPYVGPVVVSGGTFVVAFMQFDSLRMAFIVAGLAMIITSAEGFLLTPWLTSRAARMNAVAIFVNILFWGWLWNVWGMLLAVPMLMVVKAVCDHVEDFKPVGEMIGD